MAIRDNPLLRNCNVPKYSLRQRNRSRFAALDRLKEISARKNDDDYCCYSAGAGGGFTTRKIDTPSGALGGWVLGGLGGPGGAGRRGSMGAMRGSS